jgi:hypothetical protein
MPINYKFFKSFNLVYAVGTGSLTDQDCTSHAYQLFHDPDFDYDYDELLDLSRVTAVDLTNDGVYMTSLEVLQHRDLLVNAKLAIVAPTEALYGMARMYELMLSPYLRNTQVFRAVDPALDFLGLEPSILVVLKQAFVECLPDDEDLSFDIDIDFTPADDTE